MGCSVTGYSLTGTPRSWNARSWAGGQGRIKHEGGGEALRHSHGVAGDGGEIGEERVEAVNGQAVGGALGCGLVIGSFGALGLGDDGGSGRIRGGLVMIIK